MKELNLLVRLISASGGIGLMLPSWQGRVIGIGILIFTWLQGSMFASAGADKVATK